MTAYPPHVSTRRTSPSTVRVFRSSSPLGLVREQPATPGCPRRFYVIPAGTAHRDGPFTTLSEAVVHLDAIAADDTPPPPPQSRRRRRWVTPASGPVGQVASTTCRWLSLDPPVGFR